MALKKNKSGLKQCFFYPGIRDPRWEKVRIRDEHSGSYFRELSINFLRVKKCKYGTVHEFFVAIPESDAFLTLIRDHRWKNPDPG
jgi:hypothetical protein